MLKYFINLQLRRVFMEEEALINKKLPKELLLRYSCKENKSIF